MIRYIFAALVLTASPVLAAQMVVVRSDTGSHYSVDSKWLREPPADLNCAGAQPDVLVKDASTAHAYCVDPSKMVGTD